MTPIGDEDLTPRPRLSDALEQSQSSTNQIFLTDYLQTS